MNLKPAIISAAVLFVALALCIARKHFQAKAETDAVLIELRLQRTALENDLNQLADRLVSMKRSTHSSQKSTPPSAPGTGVADTQMILAELNLEEKDPKLQALYFKSNRARTQTTYSPFYRQLQLTPQQISTFEEIISQRDETVNDLVSAARSHGLTMNDPVIRKLLTEAHDEYHSQIKSFLGEPSYQKLQEYERTSWLRQLVSEIAGTATLAGVPTTTAQNERLISVIAHTSPEYGRGKPVDMNTVDWEIVDAQAATILSKEQFDAFTKLEGPNSGRFLAKLHTAISAAKKADAAAAAPPVQK